MPIGSSSRCSGHLSSGSLAVLFTIHAANCLSTPSHLLAKTHRTRGHRGACASQQIVRLDSGGNRLKKVITPFLRWRWCSSNLRAILIIITRLLLINVIFIREICSAYHIILNDRENWTWQTKLCILGFALPIEFNTLSWKAADVTEQSYYDLCGTGDFVKEKCVKYSHCLSNAKCNLGRFLEWNIWSKSLHV